jgi:hypothetical protein
MSLMKSNRPSRASVAYIYFKRAVRWRRNNWPYISGDCFADLAEYVYKPPRFRKRRGSLKDAKIIFCRSHDLNELLEIHGNEINAGVIVTGNSDFEFHQKPLNIPKSVKAFFLQNSFISDDEKFFSIPIGVEDFRLGVNGNPRHFREKSRAGGLVGKILMGPLSPTHPVREIVNERFPESTNLIEVIDERLKPRAYDKLSKCYVAVAAVRGNGIDTHRLWESLYRGVTPIVQKDGWWASLNSLFPQVISISEWDPNELGSALSVAAKSDFKPGEIEALWMPYWEKRIQSYLI